MRPELGFCTALVVVLLLQGADSQCLDGTVLCNQLAYCDTTDACVCYPGAIGDGTTCDKDSWTVRFNLVMPNATKVPWSLAGGGDVERYAMLMFNGTSLPEGFLTSIHHSFDAVNGELYLTINSLFGSEGSARSAASTLASNLALAPLLFGVNLTDTARIPVEPRVYTWSLQTTDGPIQIAPTGMTVDTVSFKPDCGENGCWVLGVTYTTGEDTFNTLFIPRAELPSSDISYDYDYDSARNTDDIKWVDWGKTAADTFQAVNFPCGSSDYDPTEVHRKTDFVINPRAPSPPDAVTSCCIPEFLDMYRPIQNFVDFFQNHPRARVRKDRCDGGFVETWHRPGWPNPQLDPPIPPVWANDGNWEEIDCFQGGQVDLTPDKLNSDKDDDYGFYWQQSNQRLGMSKWGWEERRETASCPARCGGDYCVMGDGLNGGGTYCEADVAKWMKEEKCYANLGVETVGKIDMGCYEDGEIKTWVIQAPVEWSFDLAVNGNNDFVSPTVSSMFGDEQPVVIIDVLSLSLEDENDNKNSDRWDSLQVGICKHGGYTADYQRGLRDAFIKQFCVPQFAPAWQRSAYDGNPSPWPQVIQGFQAGPPETFVLSADQMVDWLEQDSMYANYSLPDDVAGIDLFQYQMCALWVDWHAPNVGFGGEPGPQELYCPEVLWETGKAYSAGVVMPIQSGVRAGFRVVACTGSAVVKFISDAHSAHSTGFTINWRIVPQSEVSQWTGDDLGFDQGGWKCPVEPFFEEGSSATPGIAFERGQVIMDAMTAGDSPFVDGSWGMAFPPHIQEVVGDWYDNANAFCDRGAAEEESNNPQMVPAFHQIPPDYMTGTFAGMEQAWVEFTSVVDPLIRQYKATVYLDDTELREHAGVLRGTVGAEYTIDTFIGLANFKPTNTKFLDPFGMQVALHLERNNFFAVSTHGVNDYTFLEYVNMRLVAVLALDDDLLTETSSEFEDQTGQVEAGDEAHYVQITFTLGEQYRPIETGLIPMDSVVVSQGDFIESAATTATRNHVCERWTNAPGSFAGGRKGDFETRLDRDCAPQASMCASPTDLRDQFVSFNVPLGFDWLPLESESLASNVFVQLVVSAIDDNVAGGPRPADGDPGQMKTTLTGSIPVVAGGTNIFCDGVFAKTDLTDVVEVDMVVGTASSGSSGELSRLRILRDIASTDLNAAGPQTFASDSIEAGLMTLVVKGDAAYFGLGGAQLFGVQLEDVVTVHIMEAATVVFDAVTAMVATPGDENRDTTGDIDTDGYELNAAFQFTIDRAANRAHLEPTDALLSICPFRPAAPTLQDAFPTTCVTRRDIRDRQPQVTTGGVATAIELDEKSVAAAGRTRNGAFMQDVLGASDYADELGKAFSKVIADEFELDGQSRRAWWINPAYEWTPTQTGEQPLFAISQKLLLFALLNLDEGFAARRRAPRRALLQSSSSTTAGTGAGVGSTAVTFQTSPAALMAKAFGTEESRVATYQVGLRLTHTEACATSAELKTSLLATLQDYLSSTASPLDTVQVVRFSVEPNGVQCGRRVHVVSRRLLASLSAATAEAEMLVVFAEGAAAAFNSQSFAELPGIEFVRELSVGAAVKDDAAYVNDGHWGVDAGSETTSNVGLIAGCAAGGGVLVLLLAVAVLRFARSQREEVVEVAPVGGVRDLKAQLTLDGAARGLGPDNLNLFPPMGGGHSQATGLFARPPSVQSQGSHGDMFRGMGGSGRSLTTMSVLQQPVTHRMSIVQDPVTHRMSIVQDPVTHRMSIVQDPVTHRMSIVQDPVTHRMSIVQEPMQPVLMSSTPRQPIYLSGGQAIMN